MKKNKDQLSIKITNWLGTPTSLIIHTLGFVLIFGLYFLRVDLDDILLILTTLVSLEAIYLAIFIQMTVNRQNKRLQEVEADVEDILEDTEELTQEENV